MPSISGPQTKRNVRLGRGSAPLAISRAMHPRRLQDGYAAASIVIRARALVIQMAAVDDLATFWDRSPGMTPLTTVQCPGADLSFYFGG